ncbi:MAG TPA: glycosyltransferase, partial [Candidatus Woesebacteria bacterium]|nr:glycosyltransferase [Candidatus Woesebacteria bacterium]
NMVALHAAAVCLVYPSLYEGFGLPVVKSLKVKVPVITSVNSAMAEIAGSAALTVNPESVDEITLALEKITRDSSLRYRLIQSSRRVASKYSWDKTAKLTLAVYQTL